MKTVLTAINAKYIHSNLAVYSLRAFAVQEEPAYATEIEIAEYTINQTTDSILMDLYKKKPDILCFSCYLWNIEYVRTLLAELPKILPGTKIWLGGPEVSYHAPRLLRDLPQVNGIMCGEGEETFLELERFYHGEVENLAQVKGIVYRAEASDTQKQETESNAWENPGAASLPQTSEDGIFTTAPRPVMDLSRVPFVYHDMDIFKHKIIYYESSRGCPFSCSYCLSSIDKCLRFRNLELVKKELQFFIDQEVPQVKFVDRTFNCRHSHAMAVWTYIKEHDRGVTNFHFEIAADLLNDEEIALIRSMRPGLIQLEIGVQSTNEQTIREIRRKMQFDQVASTVRKIHQAGNIHQHLDLIAGLPFEDYESFRSSFNDVYALRPQQLQLGFLKVLKGSYMEEMAAEYGLSYQDMPPYEVLSTRWLSYADVIRLKGVEEMVEVYYNSGQFVHTMELLEHEFADACSMYEALADYYEIHGYFGISHTRIARYEILDTFIKECLRKRGGGGEATYCDGETFDRGVPNAGGKAVGGDGEAASVQQEAYRQALTYDLYLRENVKNRPAFAGEETVSKAEAMAFYDAEAAEHRYLKGYEQYDKRQLRKMTHLEKIDGELCLFDYQNRDILNNQAAVYVIT